MKNGKRVVWPIVCAAGLLCVGCAAAALPMRYPSRPPAQLSAAEAEREQGACVETASRAAAERAWAYIGCMVAKGHTVGVAFHVHAETTFIDVTQTRPHDALAAASELEQCRRSAYAAGRSEGGQTRESIVERMEASFGTCLGPRGYVAQRQGAAPSPRPLR